MSETDSSGNTVVRKFTNVKLRLMDERLTNIRQIVGSLKNCNIECKTATQSFPR